MTNKLDSKQLEKQVETLYANYNERAYNIIGKVFLAGLAAWIVFLIVTFVINLEGFSFDPILAIIAILLLITLFLTSKRQSKELKSINQKLTQLTNSLSSPKPKNASTKSSKRKSKKLTK